MSIRYNRHRRIPSR